VRNWREDPWVDPRDGPTGAGIHHARRHCIDKINAKGMKHILTIETRRVPPLAQELLVNQREVDNDTTLFGCAESPRSVKTPMWCWSAEMRDWKLVEAALRHRRDGTPDARNPAH